MNLEGSRFTIKLIPLTYYLLVDRPGIEPGIEACKATVFPTIPTAHLILGAPGWNRTTTPCLQNRTSTTKDTRAKFGSPAWDRTTDTLINSQVQLPLCYWGIIQLYMTSTHLSINFGVQGEFRDPDLCLIKTLLCL